MSRPDFPALMGRVRAFLRRERSWIPVAVAYLAAWWLPVSWIWAIFHPGAARPEGIDAPVSWLWKDEWGRSDSPNSFQFLLPLGVALLVWDRRAELRESWERVLRHEREGRLRTNKRTPVIVVLGCLSLGISHLIHLPALAIGALIAIGIGIVSLVYGTALLQPLRVPLAYWLLMIPPPASLISKFSAVVSSGTIRIAAVSLKAMGKAVTTAPTQIQFGGLSTDVGSPTTLGAGGAAILSIVCAVALTYGLHRREAWGKIVIRICIGALLGMFLNVARVDLSVLLRAKGSLQAADWVRDMNVWLLASPVAFLICRGDGLIERIQKARRKTSFP